LFGDVLTVAVQASAREEGPRDFLVPTDSSPVISGREYRYRLWLSGGAGEIELIFDNPLTPELAVEQAVEDGFFDLSDVKRIRCVRL
jgi:hypothetical protein